MNQLAALKILIVVTLFTIAFHLIVLLGLVPYNAIWGGRINSFEEMIVFESISLLLNLYLLFISLQLYGFIKPVFYNRTLKFSFVIFGILFGMNTIGNLFAQNIWERIFGTFFTLILTWLCLKIAKSIKLKKDILN